MTCNVLIKYPDQMNFLEFHKVAVGMAYRGARMLVRNIMGEKVALDPFAKKVIKYALIDNLRDLFEKNILDYVCPFSQAERDEGIPDDVVHNTPVKLRSTNEDEWLTFVFSADLDWTDADRSIWEIWQNVKVDIKYMQLGGAENRQ